MKFLFIRLSPYDCFLDSHPQDVCPPIDIGYSISILRKNGDEVFFIDQEAEKISVSEIIKKSNEFSCDVVGISSTTSSLDSALKIKDKLNAKFFFAFGQHAQVLPDDFLKKGFDFCVVDELEAVILELASCFKKKCFKKKNSFFVIKGISYLVNNEVIYSKRDYIKDLDKLSFPAHDLFLNGEYKVYYPNQKFGTENWGFILSSRGCSFSCIFCSPTLRVSQGKKMRYRSSKNICDEIEFLVSKGVNSIFFLDDNFVSNKNRIMDLCKEIIKRNINFSWIAQTRIDNIDSEVLVAMKNAGCSTLCFGVESGVQKVLDKLGKEQKISSVEKVFSLCRKIGILRVAFFMIGTPGETKVDVSRSIDFCKKISPDLIQVAFFTPYPGSKAYHNSLNTKGISHYNSIVYNPSKISDVDLKKLQKKFYRSYLFSFSYLFNYFLRIFPYQLSRFRDSLAILKKAFFYLFKK